MLLRRFLGVLAVLVGMCVILVWQHGERIALSYRLSSLTAAKAELEMQQAQFASLVSKLATPKALAEGVERFSLDLVPRNRAEVRAKDRFRLASREYYVRRGVD